jgi:hypothetical protein
MIGAERRLATSGDKNTPDPRMGRGLDVARRGAGPADVPSRCHMAAPVARPQVALKLPTKIKGVISFAENVANAMNNNPAFPTPNPSIATVLADIAALNTAETAVLSRTKGAVETRNAKLAVVHTDLESLKTYVQNVAGQGALANAPAVIEAAGMTSRKVTARDKAALAAKQGSVSGTVNLVAKAAGHTAAYDWQYSTDQKTWTTAPMTLQAKTGISGLTAGTTYYFRVQSLIRTGAENWSQIVSLMVK